MPIRLRLTLWYSGLLLTITFLLGVVIVTMLDRTLRAQTDETLDETLDDIESNIEVYVDNDDNGKPVNIILTLPDQSFGTPDIYIQLWSRLEKNEYPPETPAGLSFNLGTYHDPLDKQALYHDHKIWRNVEINGSSLRVVTVPVTHHGEVIGHVQVAMSLSPVEQTTQRLINIMLIGGGIALIVSLSLSNWLAGRVLSPISKISNTAQHTVAADDLSYRIPHSGSQDEIGNLITTFNKMFERLEKLFNSQRQFVSDVSHELRTPLTSIQGNVELMQRFGYDATLLNIIAGESQRMTRIVNDLLMLAQADIGQLPLNRVPIRVDDLLKRVHAQAIELSKGKVAVELTEITPIELVIDSARITQLLMSLVTNAISYTSEGQITLALRKNGDDAEISVQDTGIGIPAEHLPHIFDRFYRVDKARSRNAGGTGLGLSIAKWIAEAHGGTIEVQSVVNRGSTFTVRLPLNHSS